MFMCAASDAHPARESSGPDVDSSPASWSTSSSSSSSVVPESSLEDEYSVALCCGRTSSTARSSFASAVRSCVTHSCDYRLATLTPFQFFFSPSCPSVHTETAFLSRKTERFENNCSVDCENKRLLETMTHVSSCDAFHINVDIHYIAKSIGTPF